MKRIYLISIHLLVFCSLFAQQNNLKDIFPLAVGEKYFYSFNLGYSNQWSHTSKTDTGVVKLEITEMNDSPDSIRWQFHQWRKYWRTMVDQTPFAKFLVIDSSNIELIELKSGLHEIYTNPYINDAVFPFIKTSVDSEKMYRNAEANTSSSFIKKRGKYGNGDCYEFTFKTDTGLVKLNYRQYYSASGYNSWARYYLLDSISYNMISSVHESLNGIPEDYLLFQNYPNPFNPSTTIEYEIPSTSKVKVEVFDVLGREVELLLNKEQSAGNYKINFDGSKLNSGIYFYRITSGSYSQTKKMILVK